MRRNPPPDDPRRGRLRRDMPRPEGPFERLLKQRPERDPAPIIIGGTIAFLALVIIMVFLFSSVLGGGDGNESNASGGDGGSCTEVSPGIEGCLTTMPGLPPGLAAVSRYIEFETESDSSATIALPLTETSTDPAGIGFYTNAENRWQRVADATLVNAQAFATGGCQQGEVSSEGGVVACGAFDAVPGNLAVLRVVAQAYQVGASLPHGTTLHPDAGSVQIVTPRDYAPVSDGSVQGTPTDLADLDDATLVLPTVVGSGEDTAAVVNDILANESLRAQHIQSILTIVQNNGLDGIDLEYSGVDVDLAPEFTAFVTGLADVMHREEKRLALTLPPPTNQRVAYEWARLGEVVDFIKVLPIADPIVYWDTMPGALSLITQDVDPSKVFLVVSPFAIEGQDDVARPIGYLQAMALASTAAVREPTNPEDIKQGAEIRLVAKNQDEGEGASPMRWNTDALTVSFALGGTERKRIFVENTYSAAFKLELVQAYGLGGLAVSDGSAESDVANLWPAISDFIRTATVNLVRPSDTMLQPTWQAQTGDLRAQSGTEVTWVPSDAGPQNVTLVISDGVRRFGQNVVVEVRGANQPSSSPLQTFAPTPTPTPSPVPSETPVESATPTDVPDGEVSIEVGLLAEGDDDGSTYSNGEVVSPGSDVVYLVTIDNDSNAPVTVISLIDELYGDIECTSRAGGEVVGTILGADDGDGAGEIDGGADEVQCTYTQTAPEEDGAAVTNFVVAAAEDDAGNADSDRDDTTIVVSAD